MSTTNWVLPNNAMVEQVFKTLDTETTALFEQLDLSSLTDYPVFAFDPRKRTRVHKPPELLKDFTASPDIFMIRVRWPENSTTRMSCNSVASRVAVPADTFAVHH